MRGGRGWRSSRRGRRLRLSPWSAAIAVALPAGPGVAQAPDSAAAWWTPYDDLPPGVYVLPVDSLYEFEADHPREVELNLEAFGPDAYEERFHGAHAATWRYSFEWEYPARGLCKPTDLRILARSVLTLPDLANVETVDAELRRDWKTYVSALREHELGHRRILESHLIELRERLIAQPARSCDEYPKAFEPVRSRARQELRSRQESYDEETRHGRTQGAVWPPRPGGLGRGEDTS